MLGDQLITDPEGTVAGDAGDGDGPGLSQHVAVLAEREIGRFLAELPVAADGYITLVTAPGHNILRRLEKTTDVNLRRSLRNLAPKLCLCLEQFILHKCYM